MTTEAEQPPKCETCRFWNKGDHQDFGTCRRKAPVMVENRGLLSLHHAEWPGTWFNDWCGEHEPKP